MLNKFILDKTKIIVGHDSFGGLYNFINDKKPSKVFILVDKNTRLHCLPILLKNIPELTSSCILNVGIGESKKTIFNIQKICSWLLKKDIDRDGLIINLGGGLICDLGGFTASIIKRGVSFVNIPTTLMAQVDASIGGKVGVNLEYNKNQIGVFNNPDLILIYPPYTFSQSDNDFLSGKAEVFKYGLILDKQFWVELKQENKHKKSNLEQLILKCIQIKTKVVESDYYDKGDRQKLNFGHSISHALESCFFKKNIFISHGFALSIGMICESYISYKKFQFSKRLLDSIVHTLLKYFPFILLPKEYDKLILDYLASDKKNYNGIFYFSLIKDIGNSITNCSVSQSEVVESLDYYRTCQK